MICGKLYEQIRETAGLAFLESTTQDENLTTDANEGEKSPLPEWKTEWFLSYPGECRRHDSAPGSTAKIRNWT